jgi:uncharacterized iron-regulated membrane protein
MTLLRILHRWTGLLLAIVVLAVASTGGLLLLREPYYRAAYPALGTPITAAQAAARADILTGIEARWPAGSVQLVKFPRPGVNAYQVWLRDGTEAFVHPATGTVIDQWHWSERVPAFLFELHAHLLAEPTGSVINGIAALFLVFMALTGVVLWWPARRGAFRLRGAIPTRTSPAALLRSHAAAGALSALPIVVFAGTGAALVFYEPTAQVMTGLFDGRPPQEPDAHVEPRDAPARPWTELLAALDATFPEGQAVFYYPGSRDNARLMFRKRLPGEWHPNGRSYVVIDPYVGRTVQSIDARAQGAGTRFMHALYPVHAAKVGGVSMVGLAAFAALGLTWLACGGAWAYGGRFLLGRARRASPRPKPWSPPDYAK